MKTKNKKNLPNKTNNITKWAICILLITIYCLTIGYSAFSATNSIENIFASVKPKASARITDLLLTGTTSGAINNSEGYNVSNIYGSVSLPNADSTVTYKVSVTVFLGAEMKIASITGLNEHLDYELTGYNIGDVLCNSNNECNYGATDEFYITIKYKPNGYDSSNTTYNYNMTFNYETVDYVAKIGNIYYPTLQDAIDAVPTSGTETTVVLLKNTSEAINITAGKNVNLDLQTFTLSNNGNANVIINYGTLKITNGEITTNVAQGAINNESGGVLIVTGGSITATGSPRQCIYNNGGTLMISGTAYISSTSNNRPAVHNLASGNTTITGGTIVSTRYYAVQNAATLTIGNKDGTANASSPIFQGGTYGLYSTTNFNFYDGTIKGKTAAVNDKTKINDKEVGYNELDGTEIMDSVTYHTLHLALTARVEFNANGGTVDELERAVEKGTAVGILPIPTRTDYVFDGWFTAASGGTEISNLTVINNDTEFFAHWTEEASMVVAKIGNTEYATLQDAFDAAPNNTQTTIILVRNTREELIVKKNKNIILDLQGFKISNNGEVNVIRNYATLSLSNGTITSDAAFGAVNNENSARLTVNNLTITATGERQAIYNDKGTVTITGNTHLTSSASARATVQNLAGSTLNITGGTIISVNQQAINNAGTFNLGTKDGSISTTVPHLRGKTYGVTSTGTFKFYDGRILGITGAISGGAADVETGSSITNTTDVIDGTTYHSAYLN